MRKKNKMKQTSKQKRTKARSIHELLNKCSSYKRVIIYGSDISDIVMPADLSMTSTFEGAEDLMEKVSEVAANSKANGVTMLGTVNQNQCDLLSILLSLKVSEEMTICGFVPSEYILPPFLEWADCIVVVKQENTEKGKRHLVAHNIKPIKPVFKPTRLIREESK
jgi:hypothetical protein